MMNDKQTEKWIGYLLSTAAFCLPLVQTVSIVCFILIMSIRLMSKNERGIISGNFFKSPLFWGLPLLYLWHLVGLIWTENFKYAGLDLEIKAAFLLLPLIIGTLVISERNYRTTLCGFIAGCLTASLILLVHAALKFNETGLHTAFFYIDYSSLLMHPTYISMYLNMAILFLFHLMNGSTEKWNLKFYSALILFFFIQLLLLSARTAQAVALLTFVVAAFLYLRKGELLRLKRLHSIVILCFTLLSYFALQSINNRFNQVENAMTTTISVDAVPEYNSTTGRLEIWRESMEILRGNWLIGTGTGDVKDELIKTYEKHQFSYALDKKLNAHNQFLQVWLALGIVGLFLLMGIVAFPFFKWNTSEQPLFALFSSVIILNAMTESILEVQKGVMFFCFVYCILAVKAKF
jgi:O-antigen ligase